MIPTTFKTEQRPTTFRSEKGETITAAQVHAYAGRLRDDMEARAELIGDSESMEKCHRVMGEIVRDGVHEAGDYATRNPWLVEATARHQREPAAAPFLCLFGAEFDAAIRRRDQMAAERQRVQAMGAANRARIFGGASATATTAKPAPKVDPITEWNSALKAAEARGERSPVSAVVRANPELHRRYLDAVNGRN